MSIRNLIVSIAIASLMGCAAYRSTRPPTYGFMVGHDYVGLIGARNDQCEVAESLDGRFPENEVRAGERWLGTAYGGVANIEEARAFGASIGATRCAYMQNRLGVCGTGMTPSQLQNLKPQYRTTYLFYGPADGVVTRGFPPQWTTRGGLGYPRGSMDRKTAVVIQDMRTSPDPTRFQTDNSMERIGELPWLASDEVSKDRLVDLGRYLGADAAWIVSDLAPLSSDGPVGPSTARVVFFYCRPLRQP